MPQKHGCGCHHGTFGITQKKPKIARNKGLRKSYGGVFEVKASTVDHRTNWVLQFNSISLPRLKQLRFIGLIFNEFVAVETFIGLSSNKIRSIRVVGKVKLAFGSFFY